MLRDWLCEELDERHPSGPTPRGPLPPAVRGCRRNSAQKMVFWSTQEAKRTGFNPPRDCDGGTESGSTKLNNTQLSLEASGQRAGSVHLAEKLCSSYILRHMHYTVSARSRRGVSGSAGGCEIRSASIQTVRHKLYQTRNINRAQGCSPWTRRSPHFAEEGSGSTLSLQDTVQRAGSVLLDGCEVRMRGRAQRPHLSSIEML